MIAIIIAGAAALLLSIVGTPLYIKLLEKRGYGQFVRDDGPTSHATKRGTPTMGGVAIISATLVAYGLSHLLTMTLPSVSVLLVLFLMVGLGVEIGRASCRERMEGAVVAVAVENEMAEGDGRERHTA